jgi:C-terminal processing protease CtpA/Prc
VLSTFPDSTADRAHLRFGDKILTVNGERVSGLDSAVVRDKVRGKKRIDGAFDD